MTSLGIKSQLAMQGFGHLAAGTQRACRDSRRVQGSPRWLRCPLRSPRRLQRARPEACMRLGDCSHDGSIAARCSGDAAGRRPTCKGDAAAMQQGQAPAAPACLPSAARETQPGAGDEATKETPSSPGHHPRTAGNKPPLLAPTATGSGAEDDTRFPLPRDRRWPGTPGGLGHPAQSPQPQGQASARTGKRQKPRRDRRCTRSSATLPAAEGHPELLKPWVGWASTRTPSLGTP